MSTHIQDDPKSSGFVETEDDFDTTEPSEVSEIRALSFSQEHNSMKHPEDEDQDLRNDAAIDQQSMSWPTVYDFDGYMPPASVVDGALRPENIEEAALESDADRLSAADLEEIIESESEPEPEILEAALPRRPEERIDFGAYFGPLPSRPLSAPPDRTSIPPGFEDVPSNTIPAPARVPREAARLQPSAADRLADLDTLVPPSATMLSTPPPESSRGWRTAFAIAASVALGASGVALYQMLGTSQPEADALIEVAAAPDIRPAVATNPVFIEEAQAATAEEEAAPAANEIAESAPAKAALPTANTTALKESSPTASRSESRSLSDDREVADAADRSRDRASDTPTIAEMLRRSAAPEAPVSTAGAGRPAAGQASPTAAEAPMVGAPMVGAPTAGDPIEAPDPNLPLQPTRDEVRDAIQAVTGAVRQCAPAYGGTVVPTDLTIAPSGRVTVATVSGSLAGTPEGSCIARALRKARTPAFSGPRLTVKFPIGL